jgi:hypothetical protein
MNDAMHDETRERRSRASFHDAPTVLIDQRPAIEKVRSPLDQRPRIEAQPNERFPRFAAEPIAVRSRRPRSNTIEVALFGNASNRTHLVVSVVVLLLFAGVLTALMMLR